jgi:hypothetical protein
MEHRALLGPRHRQPQYNRNLLDRRTGLFDSPFCLFVSQLLQNNVLRIAVKFLRECSVFGYPDQVGCVQVRSSKSNYHMSAPDISFWLRCELALKGSAGDRRVLTDAGSPGVTM